MFTALSEQLTGVLNRLRGRGVLSESDVTEALREIRRHLLEADVSFEVTRGFVERVRERAVGALAIKSVSPGQQVTKLVHDELAALLGSRQRDLEFAPVGPTVMLLVGLQGSGKTTTAAKLARRLKREQKAPCLVAADVYRPAAREQLEQLGQQVGVPVFGTRDPGPGPRDVVELVQQAMRDAEQARCRTVIVDTAGRLQIDAVMMDELRDRRRRDAAARAEGALETGDGSQRLPHRPEADGGDGAAQAGALVAAGREREGPAGGARRRQAAQARRGDRPVDDAGRAGGTDDPHRIAAPAGREGRGPARAGSQSPPGAVPADEAAIEKDVSMATRIRLRRVGRKGQSYFRIVIADQRSPRDGRFVTTIGHYNPRTNPAVIKV